MSSNLNKPWHNKGLETDRRDLKMSTKNSKIYANNKIYGDSNPLYRIELTFNIPYLHPVYKSSTDDL